MSTETKNVKNLTQKEVEQIVIDCSIANGDPIQDEFFCGYKMEENFSYGDTKQSNGYLVKQVDSFGGEGQGDEMWAVYEITNETTKTIACHVRVQGYYNSWNGTEWDGSLEIVEPYEVKVTRWKTV